LHPELAAGIRRGFLSKLRHEKMISPANNKGSAFT